MRQRNEAQRQQGLGRELRRLDSPAGPWIAMGGRALLNFSSNDYLGLSRHPVVQAAAVEAVGRYGAGATASRLVCGSLAPHHELEEALADFKGTLAALTFASGYAAALGTIPALVGPGDCVILDKRAHACLVDAARLSGARLRVFAHNDLEDLEAICEWAGRGGPRRGQVGTGNAESEGSRSESVGLAEGRGAGRAGGFRQVLIVTESVFSMDGDQAPLRELVELKERLGAWLLVDEAHATGLWGTQRRGLAEALGVGSRIEVQMGTLGKALGAAGGFVCGAAELKDLLVNQARSFLFSTAPVPAQAAAAGAALGLVRGPLGSELAATLRDRVRQVRAGLAGLGWAEYVARPDPGVEAARGGIEGPALDSPILPLVVGAEDRAIALAARLREAGVFVPAIRFPTVARGAARLRVTVSAAHTTAEVASFLAALASAQEALGFDPATRALGP